MIEFGSLPVIIATSPFTPKAPWVEDQISLEEATAILADETVLKRYGDPRERDRRAVEEDVRDGYVSPASAAREYGRS